MNPKEYLQTILSDVLKEMDLAWPEKATIEPPREKKFGDLACNVAMILSKQASQNPRQLAEQIKNSLSSHTRDLKTIEIAGPGFLNFTFNKEYWLTTLDRISKETESYGSSDFGQGSKVQVEYVSANPTGPLHIGHGRGAAVGDSLARIMRFAGYEVTTEYYLNDAGRQMNVLGISTWIRYQNLCGLQIALDPDHYQGEYLIEVAETLHNEYSISLLDMPEERAVSICRERAMETILDGIKQDLQEFRVEHQIWFSENSLIQDNKVEQTIDWLKKNNMAYDMDGAVWFKSTILGDDKDRVLQKSDSTLTYFASDIAYHKDKYDRGFDLVVDIWGADHHGYVPRMKAAVQALGRPAQSLEVILVQLVNLLREGEQVAMSTRSGQFVPLKDVIQEVGTDACRFIFLSRKSDSHLDFDLEVVKRKTMDNPVYYVQYAHARICSLFAKAEERGISALNRDLDLKLLDTQEDIDLLKKMAEFPEVVASSAKNLSPHHLSYYLMELAGLLHRYYTVHPVLAADNQDLIQARMVLFNAVAVVLKNGLKLLGVTAPERM
ncbi:arginine--tRNA ligase [Desulfonatronovibrio hydrogenovorans]|uniref:arginine--tRNA ligase n=1 Tax=Desulfonatronovibrio hydrogenovorans TaxID=53245 RepID=UPI00048F2E20|nr:arginine--tRNA ligase [Desulfonatronovibrio hydrogenovorans]